MSQPGKQKRHESEKPLVVDTNLAKFPTDVTRGNVRNPKLVFLFFLLNNLHGEKDDGGQTDPAVQRVQIGQRRIGQIVRVEDGLETDGSQQQGGDHDDGMK